METEMIQAMRQILQEELKPVHDRLDKVDSRLDKMQADIDEIKDEVKVNRHTSNLLLRWAERAERSVNVGLYDK